MAANSEHNTASAQSSFGHAQQRRAFNTFETVFWHVPKQFDALDSSIYSNILRLLKDIFIVLDVYFDILSYTSHSPLRYGSISEIQFSLLDFRRRTSSDTGRSQVLSLPPFLGRFSVTDRTRPSSEVLTDFTFPIGHRFRVEVLSLISTMSPGSRERRGSFHLFLVVRFWTYSLRHLCQNCEERY